MKCQAGEALALGLGDDWLGIDGRPRPLGAIFSVFFKICTDINTKTKNYTAKAPTKLRSNNNGIY